MTQIKDTVYITVEFFDGQTESDDGHPYYVAYSDELHFVTEGATFEALMDRVRECLQLCLHDVDSIAEYGVAPDAKVKLLMELPEYA